MHSKYGEQSVYLLRTSKAYSVSILLTILTAHILRTSKAYSVSYGTPPAWPLSEQELSDSRYLYVATDPNEPDSANVVLTIQPLRADYSALGSFGTIGLVGASLMPQCITGGGGFSGPANGMCTMDADGIEGKMLASEVVNGAYAYDYTIEQKGQPKRHLRTLFAVQTEEGYVFGLGLWPGLGLGRLSVRKKAGSACSAFGASWLSGGCVQRQIEPQADPSSGQPRPISRLIGPRRPATSGPIST